MDEYSFISENGNVRQIRDLIAKEKDEQQDTEINNNKTAIDALSASVEQSLKSTVRITPPHDTRADTATELLANKAKRAIESGFLQQVGTSVVIPGGWYGQQYGHTLVTRITNYYYAVSFFGQATYIYGVYDSRSETATGYRLEGTPL